MKIEKINDNQVKLILTQSDLKERDIKLEDLTTPSEKTQSLFRDLMEQAMEECDFISENTPLMVEAVPVGLDGMMIIVTKLDSPEGDKDHFKQLSQTKELRRFKKKTVSNLQSEGASEGDILVYSFETLDDIIHLSLRITDLFQGDSAVYKNENQYFLVLQNENSEKNLKTLDLDVVLSEYGKKHVSTNLSKYYLMEHGEVIIENKAIRLLAKSFS